MRGDYDVDRQFGQKLTSFDIFATSCLLTCLGGGDDGPTLNFEHFLSSFFVKLFSEQKNVDDFTNSGSL